MASGQPIGPAPQGQYPVYAPVYQPPHKSAGESMKSLASDWIIALGAVVGLFVMWIGWLVYVVADSGDGRDVGQIVNSFGLLILTAVMMLGGIIRADMEKSVRGSLVIGAVVLVIFEGLWILG